MVSADIHFPDKTDFRVDIIDRSLELGGPSVATLRFKTNAGWVNLNMFDTCQVDAVVDCLLKYKSEQLAAGRTGGKTC